MFSRSRSSTSSCWHPRRSSAGLLSIPTRAKLRLKRSLTMVGSYWLRAGERLHDSSIRPPPVGTKRKNVRECTGLYTGLQSLRSDLIPRVTTPGGGGWGGQVMIVHGDENVVDGYRQLRIRQDPTRRPFVALTGLFLDKVQLDRALPSDQERWRLIWERAQAIWSPNANPPASTRIGTSR